MGNTSILSITGYNLATTYSKYTNHLLTILPNNTYIQKVTRQAINYLLMINYQQVLMSSLLFTAKKKRKGFMRIH